MVRRTWVVGGVTMVAFIGCGRVLFAQLEPAPASPAPDAPASSVPPATTQADKAPGDTAPGGATAPKQDTGQAALSALQAKRQEQREQAMRSFMEARGVTAQATQDAIITHLQQQEQARRSVLEAGRKLLPALHQKGRTPLPEAQTQTRVEAYETALKTYQEQRQQAEAALDEKVHFSREPQLKVMLLLLGAINDGPPILPL